MKRDIGPTTLYRLFDDHGDLLYVGIAGNPGKRFEQHAGTQPWWGQVSRSDLQHFATRAEATEAERKAIANESPKHNGKGRSSAGRHLALNIDDELHGRARALQVRTGKSWAEWVEAAIAAEVQRQEAERAEAERRRRSR